MKPLGSDLSLKVKRRFDQSLVLLHFTAAQVLNQTYAFVKLKPLKHATPESRAKAKKSAVYLQPYRQRPETCAALARRLVTGALGVRLSTAKEEREAEREQLKRAKGSLDQMFPIT